MSQLRGRLSVFQIPSPNRAVETSREHLLRRARDRSQGCHCTRMTGNHFEHVEREVPYSVERSGENVSAVADDAQPGKGLRTGGKTLQQGTTRRVGDNHGRFLAQQSGNYLGAIGRYGNSSYRTA